tara:strand:+ start:628 stop:1377 length:750 start_codon:yes stop_codon:yes gene_type:complete
MPITQKDDKWYWGNQGPFDSKSKAQEVAQAAHASGYKSTVQKLVDFQKSYNIPSPDGKEITIDEDLKLPVGEVKILQADDDQYDRGLLVKYTEDKSYEVQYWYEDTTVYPVEILIDGESVKKDAKKVTFKYHPELNDEGDVEPNEEKSIEKEEGGLAGGGTVFTSTNAGIFTPTYGGRYPTRKKKKTGIEKLGLFVTENSPQKKMEKAWGSGGVQADELARSGKMDTLESDEEKNEPEVQHLEDNKKKS